MALYSLSQNTTVTTTGAACWGFLAQADENPRIHELHISLGSATASTYGFGRAAVAGTQTSGVAVLPNSYGDITSGKSTCAVAWSVAPTIPVQFYRRVALPATIGAGVIWIFPDGIGVGPSNEMLVWNLATNSPSTNITVVSQE